MWSEKRRNKQWCGVIAVVLVVSASWHFSTMTERKMAPEFSLGSHCNGEPIARLKLVMVVDIVVERALVVGGKVWGAVCVKISDKLIVLINPSWYLKTMPIGFVNPAWDSYM